MQMVEPGEYLHYKGGRYQVVGIGLHTETEEPYVVYKPLYEIEGGQPDFWLRPLGMFTGTVVVDGAETPRFRRVHTVKEDAGES